VLATLLVLSPHLPLLLPMHYEQHAAYDCGSGANFYACEIHVTPLHDTEEPSTES